MPKRVEADALLQYTKWTPLRQLHFIDKVPEQRFEIDGVLTTPLSEALNAPDIFFTADLLRQIYVPNWSWQVAIIGLCL